MDDADDAETSVESPLEHGTAVGASDDDRAAAREAACERRAAASDAEVERVERTMTDLLSLLGKAHTMAVLREFAFGEGPWRFTELEAKLGISPNTLSERLKELTAAGLLSRRAYDEIPPRVEYVATDRAHDLFPVFGHLAQWAERHDLDPDDVSTGESTD